MGFGDSAIQRFGDSAIQRFSFPRSEWERSQGALRRVRPSDHIIIHCSGSEIRLTNQASQPPVQNRAHRIPVLCRR